MEAACPVSISQLVSALAPELAGVASMRYLNRDLTEEEIVEACQSSCKNLVVFVGEPDTAEAQLRPVHFNVQEFFEMNGLPEWCGCLADLLPFSLLVHVHTYVMYIALAVRNIVISYSSLSVTIVVRIQDLVVQ
ncbi:uncharacterized protein BDCG_16166 [Blastomyces dermatitidis ER-3]|uniref:Uncharacterized protein n=3 Tax=Blastomyces TaxID=229219 RepID=A0A179UNW5_BLAGS|nr:uncharacterized protein BDBG_17113 [Blastomyces gilchristii SLH14081]XP_045279221.1 uncharacterized protein BDCG_16166 [Blastomyces dermatitidis ER-3]KMW67186.1 hypothetical protein BDDG_11966 [Blastomyces dermatitidis ATCC 18188]OAS99493.1 hypothetical protein BDCG_16166 [Blastomyces dermatitidis ER-3]OAT08787.1 hypothetical protein BDBG_17113 [Blastomyces gilchristii SLH14081]